jgi:hypothetical protein
MTDRPEPAVEVEVEVEPAPTVTDPLELLVAYLDWYRATAVRKVVGMGDAELRSSRLPSGWTPIQLVNHLAFMERRWLQWGWGGLDVPDPWGDNQRDSPGDPWFVSTTTSLDEVVTRLSAAGEATRRLVRDKDLLEQAPAGPRFAEGAPIPDLAWILVHVLQEYARHVGHLDIVRELIDGDVGE